jgi:hypothetical protein
VLASNGQASRMRRAARFFSIFSVAWIGCKADPHPAQENSATPSLAITPARIGEGSTKPSEIDNAIEGSVNGYRFTGAVTALSVLSDGAGARTIVYLFSTLVTCTDLSFTGWDERVPEGTGVVSLQLFAPTPGELTVVPTDALAAGQASATFTRTSRAKTPIWMTAKRGIVTLGASEHLVSGEIVLWFGGDHLAGFFKATRCPLGHEP